MWSWETEYPRQTAEIIEYSKLVYDRHLVSAAGGNVSCRCGDKILITASNASLRNIRPADLLLCDAQGNVLEGDAGQKPSKETKFHLNVYALRPDVNCVIHAHPCCCAAYSISGRPLPMLTDSARLKLVQVPLVPEALPGSAELADHVRQSVEQNPQATAFLMEAHGCLTLGATMKECFDTTELLEDTAKIAVLTRILQ